MIFKNNFFLILLGVCALFFINSSYHMRINTPILNFDEAGQLFISKGFCHNAPAYALHGTLLDALKANFICNFDPGGFTFLIRYWSEISTNAMFLKLLPVIFLLLTLGILFFLLLKISRDPVVSLVLACSPLFFENIWQCSFYLRAYTMQFLCITTLVFYMYRYLVESYRITFGSVLLILFLASSRYTAWLNIFMGFASVWLVYKFDISKFFKNKKHGILSAGIIFFLLSVCLYGLSFHFIQNNNSLTPTYTYSLLLSNMTLIGKIKSLASNIWSLPIVLFVISVAVINYLAQKDKVVLFIKSLMVMFFLSNAFYIITSFFGIHPWTLNERFNSDMVMLSGIIFALSLAVFWEKKLKLKHTLAYKLVLIFFLMLPFVNSLNIYHHSNHNDVFGEIKKISSNVEIFFVSKSMWATIKYLYEYGALKDDDDYPNKFVQIDQFKEKFKIRPNKKYAFIRHNIEILNFDEIFEGQYSIENISLILRSIDFYVLTGK